MSKKRPKSQNAIDQMNEALRLMNKSVQELHDVVGGIREGRIMIVESKDQHDE